MPATETGRVYHSVVKILYTVSKLTMQIKLLSLLGDSDHSSPKGGTLSYKHLPYEPKFES